MRRYIVTGPHHVFDHQPGEQFSHDYPPEQETRHLEAGAVARVRREPVYEPESPDDFHAPKGAGKPRRNKRKTASAPKAGDGPKPQE